MNSVQRLEEQLQDTYSAVEQLDQLAAENPADEIVIFNLRAVRKRRTDLERRLRFELSAAQADQFESGEGMPRIEVQEQKIPKFEIADTFALSRITVPPRDHERLQRLQPILQSLSGDLIETLNSSNLPYDYLRDRAKAYAEIVGQSFERINFLRLHLESLRLLNTVRAFEKAEQPPLNIRLLEVAETLGALNYLFMQVSAEGAALVAASEHNRLSTRDEMEFRKAALEFAKILQDHPDVVDPSAAITVLEAAKEIGKDRDFEKISDLAYYTGKRAYRTAKNINEIGSVVALIILACTGVVAIGSAALGTIAGASVMVLSRGIRQSKTVAKVTALITKGLDRISGG